MHLKVISLYIIILPSMGNLNRTERHENHPRMIFLPISSPAQLFGRWKQREIKHNLEKYYLLSLLQVIICKQNNEGVFFTYLFSESQNYQTGPKV